MFICILLKISKYVKQSKNVELFEKHKIFTKVEVESRVEILLENYSTTISIEAATMLDMLYKDIIPAFNDYSRELLTSALDKKALGIEAGFEVNLVDKLNKLGDIVYRSSIKFADELKEASVIEDSEKKAIYYHDIVYRRNEQNTQCCR